MATESQITKGTTHARLYRDKKERLQKIAFTRSLAEGKVTEIAVLDEIMEIGLPRVERKYGLKAAKV